MFGVSRAFASVANHLSLHSKGVYDEPIRISVHAMHAAVSCTQRRLGESVRRVMSARDVARGGTHVVHTHRYVTIVASGAEKRRIERNRNRKRRET